MVATHDHADFSRYSTSSLPARRTQAEQTLAQANAFLFLPPCSCTCFPRRRHTTEWHFDTDTEWRLRKTLGTDLLTLMLRCSYLSVNSRTHTSTITNTNTYTNTDTD